MADISLIVEGEEDIRFLQDFIQYHFGKTVEKDSFIEIGGKSEKLFKSQAKIQSSTGKGNTNILIFDADDNDHSSTLSKINTKVSELSLQFDSVFLFPDNKSKGNLETLLRSCINPVNRGLLKCIKDYSSCKAVLNLSNSREIDEKTELFIYHDSFDIREPKGTHRSYLIEDIWNLDAEEVLSLKEFLRPFFL